MATWSRPCARLRNCLKTGRRVLAHRAALIDLLYTDPCLPAP